MSTFKLTHEEWTNSTLGIKCKLKLDEKIEAVIKRIRWKAFYFEQSDTRNKSKNIYYGLTSDKTPPPMKILGLFEKDSFKIVEKIKFRKINCEFQDKLNSDIKDIKSSRKTLTPADKTSNFHKITKETYEQLLHNSVTKTYKKENSNITKTINEQGKKIANKKNILDRIQVNGKEECFVTLKDHKQNLENNPTAILINPVKNEIGRISKVILENINKELGNKLQLQQWNNATAVINWFKKIENKSKYKYMIFDIKDFHSSISKKALDDSINFMRQRVQIKREDFSIIQHARKSLLYNKGIWWQKKNYNNFDVATGAYHGAEVCEIVALLFLNNLAKKFEKNSVGLYKDDRFALFKNINGHRADKIRKEFHQLFTENGLSLEIECSLNNCKLSRYYFRLQHWHLQTISQT